MDRDRDRGRYREGSVEWMGRGESYRPAGSRRPSPPPPPRAPPTDTYLPPTSRARPRSRSPDGFRRRSRSPRRDGNWRDAERARSPPRRGFSPSRVDTFRRDTRDRSPRRDGRFNDRDRFARSPPRREWSPTRRSRDVSPAGSRGLRSPRRDRATSPRGRYEQPRSRGDSSPARRPVVSPRDRGYRARSRSPRRNDRPDPYAVDTWRKRSPSAGRDSRVEYQNGRDSGATSRRSSPPVHPSRAGYVPDERPVRAEGVSHYSSRTDSPPNRERTYDAPPSGPQYRTEDANMSRQPPTGPAGSRIFSSNGPPSGPSVSAHSRNPILSAPSRPRGGGFAGTPGHHGARDYNPSYGGGSRRPSGSSGMQYSNPTFRSGPPGRGGPSTGPGPRPDVPYRSSSNSTSTTYPRSQRFGDSARQSHHLADLPQIIPEGRKMSDGQQSSRLKKLEDEMERLRQTIADKERALQPELRNWAKLERESEKAAFKSQMAEESLRGLSGDEGGGVAF